MESLDWGGGEGTSDGVTANTQSLGKQNTWTKQPKPSQGSPTLQRRDKIKSGYLTRAL